MRVAVAFLVGMLAAVPAGAVQLQCFGNLPGGFASCEHPNASLPVDIVHIDAPGTFNAHVSFASALTNDLELLGSQDFHFDVYDPGGHMIGGDNGFVKFFVDFNIPAGLTGFSFQYTIPDFFVSTTDWLDRGETDSLYTGTDSRFELTSNSALPAFTFDVSKVNAVPEPASWALMIAGFGAVGATMRRRRYSAAS